MDIKAFDVELDHAQVVEDDSKTYFHTFLIPSKGFAQINIIHDLLYTDKLLSEFRTDIPFIPHLGIGNNSDENVMNELAQTINASNRSVVGKISMLTVAEFDGSKVADVRQIHLG